MSNDLTPVEQTRPAFLQSVGADESVKEMSKYLTLSMVKVIQKMSSDDLIEEFGVGQPILTPERIAIPAPFVFVPLLFYPQWIKWASIKSNEGILDSSLDPRSEIAIKAQSNKTWSERREDGKGENRYVEHLNFIVLLPEIAPMPVVMSFARAEHKTGKRLVNLITMRQAPIYSMRFEAVPSSGPKRTNESGSWWGLDIDNASEPWVSDEETYNVYRSIHEDMKSRREDIKLDFEAVETPQDHSDTDDSDYA